jgi:hypothetical protein
LYLLKSVRIKAIRTQEWKPPSNRPVYVQTTYNDIGAQLGQYNGFVPHSIFGGIHLSTSGKLILVVLASLLGQARLAQ